MLKPYVNLVRRDITLEETEQLKKALETIFRKCALVDIQIELFVKESVAKFNPDYNGFKKHLENHVFPVSVGDNRHKKRRKNYSNSPKTRKSLKKRVSKNQAKVDF